MAFNKARVVVAASVLFTLACPGVAFADESVVELRESEALQVQTIEDGWRQEGDRWFYYQDGTALTGWLEMWSTWYYFDETGAMVTGWRTIDGLEYYFYPSGAMATEWVTLDTGTYYFGLNGYLRKGWLFLEGCWYWLGEWGAMTTGWAQIGQDTYHFEPTGKMSSSWSYDEGWYHFDWSGSRSLGLQSIDGSTYLFGDDGKMLTGWQEHDGKTYYFEPSGQMRRGWLLDEGRWYWLGDDGTVTYGWLTLGSDRYYLNADEGGAMVTGWQFIDGAWHAFTDVGPEVKEGWFPYNNAWSYITEGGGFFSGWAEIEGSSHYFEPNGVARQGWLCDQETWYYLNEWGEPFTGWTWIGDKQYRFDEQGAMLTGWIFEDGGWYCLGESGYLRTNDRKEGSNWYCYFAETGERLTGFVGLWDEDGSYRTCYYDPQTCARAAGSVNIDGVTFYFDPVTGALEGDYQSIPLYINNLVEMAWDDSHGYDQEYRWGQYGDYDCSSLTVVCADDAGLPVGDASFTGDMREGFLQSPDWEWIPWTSNEQLNSLRAGDVLLKEFSHVYTYLGGGQIAEAQYNEFHGAVGGDAGDQTGTELLVRPLYLYYYGLDGILRYRK